MKNTTEEQLKKDLQTFKPLSIDDIGINGNYAKILKELIDYNPKNINLVPFEILGKGETLLTNNFWNKKETTFQPLLNFSDYSELAKYAIEKGASVDDLHQDYIVSSYLEIFEQLSTQIKNCYENNMNLKKFNDLSINVQNEKGFDVIMDR